MSLFHSEESRAEVWQITEEETVVVQRKVMAQRVIDGLILTFFVHVLPADIRLAPKHAQESRLMFALHPALRSRIMKIIIPLRALDYMVLGGVAMVYKFDTWQCICLVSMLFLVLRLKGPPLAREAALGMPEAVPDEVLRR